MNGNAPRSAPPAVTFFGGTIGAVLPLVVFLTGVAWLGLSGAPDERGFWPVLVVSLGAGTLLATDRAAYGDAVVRGMAQPLVMIMVLAWLLAGILGSLMNASGFVDALVEAATRIGLTGGGFVAMAFLVCALVSTATGTSLGTLIICMPLLYPPVRAVGADPAMAVGAMLSGATFGDNISPVSDTTIASAHTQGADLGGVVRSRLRYALPAAAVALAVFSVAGSGAEPTPTGTPAGGSGLVPLVMMAVPVLVVWLLIAGRSLLVGLLAGIGAGCVVALGFGLIEPSALLWIDREAYRARGIVVEGMQRGVGVSIFTILLMGIVGGVEAGGVVDRVLEAVRRRARSARGAEAWIVGAVTAAVFVTTHSVVAILTVGRFARDTGAACGVSPYRRANLLDMTVCTYPFLFPFFVPTILAASLTASGASLGAPHLTPWSAGLHNIHSWALLGMVVVAVWGGYGRRAPVELSDR